ncbi:MAG: undecaprenyldiphospho-muramoylpentapeptide beta-N-acetylglucosaminyltransferase [Candidatus Nanopelagicales bacterium]
MSVKVLICGGATAGHLEPALNVAYRLISKGAEVEFVGTTRGLDQQLISGAGFALHLITPVPLPRSLNLSALIFPFKLSIALLQSVRICKRYRPNSIVGFGSFVALPMYIASRILRIPLVIHEANAKAGIANQIGARIAKRKFQAVDDSLSGAETVGIPLRSIYNNFEPNELRRVAQKEFEVDPGRRTILVFGGSQGARHINEVVNAISDQLTADNIQLLHIVGNKNADQMRDIERHHYFEYVGDMSLTYAVADLVVCRAGALTVAEVSATNTPAIFIPFPTGNGEQEKNAQSRVSQGAARMLLDKDLNPQSLLKEIQNALMNLESMKVAGTSEIPRNATATIADSIFEVAS